MNTTDTIAKSYNKEAIYDLLKQHKITEHPLITAISQLSLNADQIQIVALNIYHVVKNFPRFLSAIITNIGQHETCMVLVDNLYEEYGRMNREHIHLQTYRKFIQQLGITLEMIDAFEPHVSVVAYVRAVLDLCLHYPYREGLAALGVIEDIVHQVSDIIGITVNREKKNEERVYHFDEHKVLDERHADEIYDLLIYENDTDLQQIEQGLQLGLYYHSKLYSDIYQQATASQAIKENFSEKSLTKPVDYPLEVGEKGRSRLTILNFLYNENSIRFIKRFICKPNMTLLEVGCGTGQLAYELAQQTDMKITAIDISPEQIQMAQRNYTHEAIQFKCCEATQIQQLSQTYDIIYLRWVLIYLPEAKEVIQACYEWLNPNGILIIEDNDACSSACYSPDKMDLIRDWEKIWQTGIETISGHTSLSTLVQSCFQQFNMKEIRYETSQSILKSNNEKLLFALGIEESRASFMKLGFKMELVDHLRDKFAQIAESPYPVSFVRNFQIGARK